VTLEEITSLVSNERAQKNLSQAQLSELTGICQSTIGDFENGNKYENAFNNINKLINTLGFKFELGIYEPKSEEPEYIDLELEKHSVNYYLKVSTETGVHTGFCGDLGHLGLSHWEDGVEYELCEYVDHNDPACLPRGAIIVRDHKNGGFWKATHARFYRKDLIK